MDPITNPAAAPAVEPVEGAVEAPVTPEEETPSAEAAA